MPAETWTFTGCFGRPFSFGCSHFRWNVILLWFSIITEHSSVKITSNCSCSVRHLSANSTRLMRFGLQMSWQYLVPVCTQPSIFRSRFTFDVEKRTPNSRSMRLAKPGEVSSSLASIFRSTKSITSTVTLVAERPGFGALSNDCLSL